MNCSLLLAAVAASALVVVVGCNRQGPSSEKPSDHTYVITLSKDDATKLLDMLDNPAVDVSLALAERFGSGCWKAKLLRLIVGSEIVLFRTRLAENLGPAGATIHLHGPSVAPVRTALEKINVLLENLPEEWRFQIDTEAGSTVPVYWTIRARR